MFRDRDEAGRLLGEAARERGLDQDAVVAGVPRGGVPVAAQVARVLGAPLDLVIVRKLGCPWQPELGIGAIGEAGAMWVDEPAVAALGVTPAALEEVADRERIELVRRVASYRGGRPAIPIAGRQVMVVDDGIATGGSMIAAIEVLRERGAASVVVATPVAPPEAVRRLSAVADDVIAVSTPLGFHAIGGFYEDFHQVDDEEVLAALASAA